MLALGSFLGALEVLPSKISLVLYLDHRYKVSQTLVDHLAHPCNKTSKTIVVLRPISQIYLVNLDQVAIDQTVVTSFTRMEEISSKCRETPRAFHRLATELLKATKTSSVHKVDFSQMRGNNQLDLQARFNNATP